MVETSKRQAFSFSLALRGTLSAISWSPNSAMFGLNLDSTKQCTPLFTSTRKHDRALRRQIELAAFSTERAAIKLLFTARMQIMVLPVGNDGETQHCLTMQHGKAAKPLQANGATARESAPPTTSIIRGRACQKIHRGLSHSACP